MTKNAYIEVELYTFDQIKLLVAQTVEDKLNSENGSLFVDIPTYIRSLKEEDL